MGDFDLDLGAIERDMELDDEARIVLGVLDGTTSPVEWVEEIAGGNVLILNIAGDLNELAAGFAREIRDSGGSLVHFRDFLVVTPPGVEVDTERLD